MPAATPLHNLLDRSQRFETPGSFTMKSSYAVLMCAVVVAACVSTVSAVKGVDVSGATMPDAFRCLRKNGYEYAIIRAWQSNGVPDPNGPHTVYNAWDGGMRDVDVYLFPGTSPRRLCAAARVLTTSVERAPTDTGGSTVAATTALRVIVLAGQSVTRM